MNRTDRNTKVEPRTARVNVRTLVSLWSERDEWFTQQKEFQALKLERESDERDRIADTVKTLAAELDDMGFKQGPGSQFAIHERRLGKTKATCFSLSPDV